MDTTFKVYVIICHHNSYEICYRFCSVFRLIVIFIGGILNNNTIDTTIFTISWNEIVNSTNITFIETVIDIIFIVYQS